MKNEPNQSSPAHVWQMIRKNIEPTGDSPRRIVDGGLLGISVAFLIALLNVQSKDIDAQLNAALIAFVIALPLLAEGFRGTFYKRPRIVPHSGPENLLAASLTAAWIVEAIGWFAAYIGIFFAIWHISVPALIAFVSASVFVAIILPALSFIGLVVYSVYEFKKQGQKQHDTGSTLPGDT